MNDEYVSLTNGAICLYKTVNLKTKLFTKLTNQNSYDEARALGCVSNTERQELLMVTCPIYTVLKCSCFFYQVLFQWISECRLYCY